MSVVQEARRSISPGRTTLVSQRSRDQHGSGQGPGGIERDLAQTRSRLAATIDTLERRLSPGAVVDQAIASVKETGGGELGRNLMLTVRDHPIPVVLIGIGIAWLMLSGRRSEDERRRAHGRGSDQPHPADYAARQVAASRDEVTGTRHSEASIVAVEGEIGYGPHGPEHPPGI
jgi:Protein of unknown function (DUF3618)